MGSTQVAIDENNRHEEGRKGGTPQSSTRPTTPLHVIDSQRDQSATQATDAQRSPSPLQLIDLVYAQVNTQIP